MRKSLQRSQNCGGMKAGVSPHPDKASFSPQDLGLFDVSQRVLAGTTGHMQTLGSKCPFLSGCETPLWPLRRRRRRCSTYLDAVQRRDAHVQEDAVEHRHGDVLGTGEKRSAYPEEGGGSFPVTGTMAGDHGRAGVGQGNPAPPPQVPKRLQGGSGEGGSGMFYLQDGRQEDGNPRQHEDDDACHSLLPGTAREAG